MAITSPREIEEALIVNPHTPEPEKSPGISKRKGTPSSELSSSSKSFILSPHGAFSSERTALCLGDSPLFVPSMRLFPSGETTRSCDLGFTGSCCQEDIMLIPIQDAA
ncbi:uncharacterized protein P174DRAFT_430571 [Aspergillus novofumigatus IBT 16806]|uniref:Uncharacterized protein n=1 Tax=Aspergillus novofumigatus (strain IBT 16806) TaxID=1392255 RepID=A0A2I1C7M0_ASPN1|nr:uncharacterized protein P174DRAFT_430571 [Aspergillus novofumigatus IBT 16806]PKX93571.1 hypothetical protein P174DRAFT_430571 [Aspergillus novofumigatus IBT 16806]